MGTPIDGGIIPARAGFTRTGRARRSCAGGSSPLARGLPLRPPRPPTAPRIIPARAGFTPPGRGGPGGCPDHPRSRGVYRQPAAVTPGLNGSSPLARGLHLLRSRADHVRRIIPARAGFTTPGRGRGRASRDHPRSRGVYHVRPEGARLVEGSSPLARGLPRLVPGGWRVEGIIPARAGFTRPPLASPSWPPDHPRSRGVYAHVRHERALAAGSSPLARGLRLSRSTGEPVTRIIPARAGFTSDETVVWRAPADHPRSRGVYGPGCGSRRERAGIIPARAGFTAPRRARGRWPRDHPRSRGVYLVAVTSSDRAAGSSPLARGLHPRRVLDVPVPGIIPARAGFTARA